MKVLVTGGAGFIGGHLVEKLLEMGYEVCSLDDESATSSDNFNWFQKAKNYKFSILEKEKLEDLFYINKFKYVFHLAAETKIGLSIEDPTKCFDVNINGTLNILELSKKYNIEKVIYASSSSVYGLLKTPNSEDSGTDCLNPYAASKLCNEVMAATYTKIYGLKTIGFRFFNVFGERMPSCGAYAPVIAIFQRQLMNGQSMTVTGDGLQKRDFIHVSDVVEGLINGMLTENPQTWGNYYNLGSGKNTSVIDIAKFMGNSYIHIPERMGDAKETLADLRKVKNDLNWEPKNDLFNWIKNNINAPRKTHDN